MARIFRHQYSKTLSDGRKTTKALRKWYVEYRDAQGIVRRVPGYTDRAATAQLAAELERQAAREQSGLVDRFVEHRKRPLAEHLGDYAKHLAGCSPHHVATVLPRVRKVLTGCRFTFWPDLSASAVQGFLAELRAAGKSVQTCNFYLSAVKAFCRWAVRDGRAPDNPLAHVQGGNVRTDRRHDRRALSEPELRRLLDAARSGPERFGMPGPLRALVYQVAVETGLRVAELRSLTWGSFELEADPPAVTVKAAYSKHRRDDVLPLKASTAQTLTRWRAQSDDTDLDHRPFGNLPDKTAVMLRADLTDAEIPYRDDSGRVADFHALRHTFISNLARGGVHPKLAQQLARHSTISLTMDRYTHTVVGELSDALAALPELDAADPNADRLRATGTDEKSMVSSMAFHMAERGASTLSPSASARIEAGESAEGRGYTERQENGIPCTSIHSGASCCSDDSALRRAGVEPATFGSVDRCSIRLS